MITRCIRSPLQPCPKLLQNCTDSCVVTVQLCFFAAPIADVHTRTDANNLVTTASATHQPEQKETMHLIQMLREESTSGQMHDLAHVRSEYCLADSLMKHSASPDELITAVLTGNLLNVNAHPPFRTMLQNKAFLVQWLAHNTKHGPDIFAFAGVGIAESMFAYWGIWA